MSDIKKPWVSIVGRAGKDAERPDPDRALTKFTLAVEVGWNPELKIVEKEWWDVATWDGLSDTIWNDGDPVVKKGMVLCVTGVASVYESAAGDRKQINGREVGLAAMLRSKYVGKKKFSFPKKLIEGAPLSGTFTADLSPDEEEMYGVTW